MSNPRQIPEADVDRMYEAEKQRWIAEHPEATPEQYEKAMRAIAERLRV